MKIVIIDDDISFLEMFNKKINSSMKKIFDQVIIDQYTNINLFPFQYDIYFLDIDLIDDNGISIAGKIKENDKNKDMPVLMMYADSFAGWHEKYTNYCLQLYFA